jgi:arginine-tRNA-protein transferase
VRTLFTFASPPAACSYLPGRAASQRYEVVASLSAAEYADRLLAGWRRFGHSLFRPDCPSCTACQSLRVDAARFRPRDTQKRVAKLNADLELTVGPPAVAAEKLDLYDRFHAAQADRVGWPDHGGKSAADYHDSFVDNPFPAEEWCYRLNGRLVGVGYVDRLAVGLSAVYFFHEPGERRRSLGVFNVLSVVRATAAAGLAHAYLGYYVEGCRSLEYKAKYRPNEVVGPDGVWRPFLA